MVAAAAAAVVEEVVGVEVGGGGGGDAVGSRLGGAQPRTIATPRVALELRGKAPSDT